MHQECFCSTSLAISLMFNTIIACLSLYIKISNCCLSQPLVPPLPLQGSLKALNIGCIHCTFRLEMDFLLESEFHFLKMKYGWPKFDGDGQLFKTKKVLNIQFFLSFFRSSFLAKICFLINAKHNYSLIRTSTLMPSPDNSNSWYLKQFLISWRKF